MDQEYDYRRQIIESASAEMIQVLQAVTVGLQSPREGLAALRSVWSIAAGFAGPDLMDDLREAIEELEGRVDLEPEVYGLITPRISLFMRKNSGYSLTIVAADGKRTQAKIKDFTDELEPGLARQRFIEQMVDKYTKNNSALEIRL